MWMPEEEKKIIMKNVFHGNHSGHEDGSLQ